MVSNSPPLIGLQNAPPHTHTHPGAGQGAGVYLKPRRADGWGGEERGGRTDMKGTSAAEAGHPRPGWLLPCPPRVRKGLLTSQTANRIGHQHPGAAAAGALSPCLLSRRSRGCERGPLLPGMEQSVPPPSLEQRAETLLCLSPAEVADLREGINFFRNKSTGQDYIFYKNKGRLRACKNLCKHQGGLFIKDIEDLDGRSVKCTKHNWRLDVSTMKYINPPGSFCQDELVVEMDEDNGLLLLELNPPNPWDADPRAPEELAFGEVQVTYLTHACMDLKLGDKRMVFDPWLTGPAFARGWWLLHEPPADWLERLCRADLVYISHMHSDHLSYPTLRKLAARRPDIPIYVGNTERPVFWHLPQSGVQLTNINVVPFGTWQQVDENLRFMILMDGVHPEMDTCIIVEYKGHKILNTVDCTRPNGGRLPAKVALMMSDFAGGASGFPMTFSGGKFTEEWKAQFIRAERRKLLHYKARLVRDLQPRVFCPFAGYFVEAHPSDRYIKDTNTKNDPRELNSLIKKSSEVVTWTPRPGATLDLGQMLKDPTDSKCIAEPPGGTKVYKDTWDFGPYLEVLNAAVGDAVFQHQAWIQEYFTWAGFKDYNLVVRVIETDEDFSPFPGGYDYLVDFLDLSFPEERPSREHPYEEIRSRVDVMRHVVKHGLLWDGLYIGFQTRLRRDPDIYHHLFWNHFQIKLPLTPPNWQSFLMLHEELGPETSPARPPEGLGNTVARDPSDSQGHPN